MSGLTTTSETKSQDPCAGSAEANAPVRSIAFYLPQYHPIPENDGWWGKGYTEWHRVVRSRPRFRGHYQPHLPADLGFYDLRLPETREAQAEMAQAYGIHGFCYYHYWFNGKRKLERPFNEVLASGKPDFPFCLCWANDNWTRAWENNRQQILTRQNYNADDDRAHIRSLLPAFADRRYLRIDGKPLFLVYHAADIPEPRRTCEIWREEAQREGAGELYLALVESYVAGIDPRQVGFDGAVEFAPDWRNKGRLQILGGGQKLFSKLGLLPKGFSKLEIADYDFLLRQMIKKPWPAYDFFRGVTPGFDNSARREENPTIFVNSSPQKYEDWLRQAVARTRSHYQGDRRLVFINAWNEWGEGNHLEPDQKYGRAFLEATKNGLARGLAETETVLKQQPVAGIPPLKRAYWQGRKVAKGLGGFLRQVTFRSL